MGRVFFFNIVRFIILIAAQVVLFKNMGYYNLASPFPYILIILAAPSLRPWLANVLGAQARAAESTFGHSPS